MRSTLAPRARLGALLSCALLFPLLPGCALYNRVFHRHSDAATCRERPFVGNTDSRPPLQVPAGLSAPDTRNSVKIPQLPEPPPAPSSTEPCLALPPPFSAKPPAVKPATPADSTAAPRTPPAVPAVNPPPAPPAPPAAPPAASHD
jgi:hypothetical protein